MTLMVNGKLKTLIFTMMIVGVVCCSGSKNDNSKPAPHPSEKANVDCYVTTANSVRLFSEDHIPYSKTEMSPYKITILPSERYQSVDGFGPALTGSTCYNLLKMSETDRKALLKKCFDPKDGVGFNFIRMHIGGSDFSMDEYTCCDKNDIKFFEIPEIEKKGIFPILKEIMKINPNIKIIGSPWSCPKWMKVNVDDLSKPYDSWTSGRLNPKFYDQYAEYFVQWVTEMEANGFPIYAITIQNEPLNKGNSMSLYMPWQDQLEFVKVLGPAFKNKEIKTKILVFDHNYNYDNQADQKDYPLHIYDDLEATKWVDGSAWHNYGGNVTELDHIHSAAPDKSIYFTEASIGAWNYDFSKCLLNDFNSIFLGTLSRYGKGVLLWNMMLDDKNGPFRPNGCSNCFGAIEINSSDYKTLKFNSQYYNLAHCSKVILPDAVRIGTKGFTTPELNYLAFRNPDGSTAFVVLNNSSNEQIIAVYETSERSFKYTVPAKSITSFLWGNQ